MAWTKKLWGVTRELLNHPSVEVHVVKIEAGGYCSRHHHKHKWNAFAVTSGELEVEMSDLGTIAVLKAGDFYSVPPGVKHRFLSRSGCEAFEIYYPVPVGTEDIQRFDIGGQA